MTFVHAHLACRDAVEAQTIGSALLNEKLIVCFKIIGPVESTYWWKEKLEKGGEVLVVMETHESRMAAIEEMVQKLHSYETFVLTATPLVYVSKDARVWMQNTLNLLGN